MALHDDLLRQALRLAHNEPVRPKQASLRRAVSTAYYSLFHLLVSDAAANWKRKDLRPQLGRAFDHGTMKAASNRVQDRSRFPLGEQDPLVVSALRNVAKAFTQLQEQRHAADYDNSRIWSRTQALVQVKAAEQAFADWARIREHPLAQEYLVSLLVKRRD